MCPPSPEARQEFWIVMDSAEWKAVGGASDHTWCLGLRDCALGSPKSMLVPNG